MGVTAFSTAFFPRVPPETIIDTANLFMHQGGGVDVMAALKPYLPLLVAMGVLLVLPFVLGLCFNIALVCIAPCRCSQCCRRCCHRKLEMEQTSSKYRCCCFYTGLAANVIGLCGCIGMFVAVSQPFIGVDNMFRVVARTTDRVYDLASDTISTSDSLINALISSSDNSSISPISNILNKTADEASEYISAISKSCTLRVVSDVLSQNSSLAEGVSTILLPPASLPSLSAITDFSDNIQKNLDLLLNTKTQESVKKSLEGKQNYGNFSIRSTQPPSPLDDTAISEASYKNINKKSLIGGAVFAANSITNGIAKSLDKQQPPVQEKWQTIIEKVCKQAFKDNSGDSHCTTKSSVAAASDSPIDRADLNVPVNNNPETVIKFVIDSLRPKASGKQQSKDDTQLLVDLLEVLSTKTSTVGDIVRRACGKPALKGKLSWCASATRAEGGPTDEELARSISDQLNLPKLATDALTQVSSFSKYINYVLQLHDHKEQMTARALFDAFINNGACPGYITDLPVEGGALDSLKNCKLSGFDPATIPPVGRNYVLISMAPFLLALALLLVPIGTFICGIVGVARFKTKCAGCSLCCNGCVVCWVSLFLMLFGIVAVVLQKFALEYYSGLLTNPDKLLRNNYDTVLQLLKNNGVIGDPAPVQLDLGSFVLRHTGHPDLVYTAPSSAVLDYTTYDALRKSLANVTATVAVGNLPSTFGIPAEPDDSMASLSLSTRVETTRMSIKDLLYYNKKGGGILDILGLPDLLGELQGLLPAVLPEAINPRSSLSQYLETFIVPDIDPFLSGIRNAFLSGELSNAVLFGDFSAGHKLYNDTYSSTEKRTALYGDVDVSALAAMNVTAQVEAYIRGISSSANYSALSLEASAKAVRGQKGIVAECLSMIHFLDTLVAMTKCPSVTFLVDNPVDKNLCSQGSIKGTMQKIRVELTNLKTSCPSISTSLSSIVHGSPYPDLVGNLCTKIRPGDTVEQTSICVSNTYATVRDLVYALQEKGFQTIGWNAASNPNDGSSGALDVVLDTTRVYERFVDVFKDWSSFSTDEVSFIDAYTELLNAVVSPLSILLDIIEANMVSKNLSGGLYPRFSQHMYDTVLMEFGSTVNKHVIEPLDVQLNRLLDILAGPKGLVTPYVLEVVPESIRSLTLGTGLLETFGAIFFCQYLIWAGLFFGGICQNVTFRYLYSMEFMRSKDYKEAMIENSMSVVSLTDSELFPMISDCTATEMSVSRVYDPVDSTTSIFTKSGQLSNNGDCWDFRK